MDVGAHRIAVDYCTSVSVLHTIIIYELIFNCFDINYTNVNRFHVNGFIFCSYGGYDSGFQYWVDKYINRINRTDNFEEFGISAYYNASFFNHSCDPNV